jgi:PAS domain S-box-containing protein
VPDKNYLENELETLIQSDPDIWRFIRQSSLDGVWYWDLEKPENEYMSPEFWELFGFDPKTKKHLSAEWQDLIHPDDLKVAQANFEAHRKDPSHPYDQVVRYTRAAGGTAWVRCRGIAIRDETGRAIRMLGAHNDITDLVQHRTAYETNSLVEVIMNTAESAIIGLDSDGAIASLNSAGRHFLGGLNAAVPFRWPEEISFLESVSLRPLKHSKNPIIRSLEGNSIKGEVFLMTRKTHEEPRYVRVSTAQVEDETAPLHCVIIMDDVSEQEKNRQQVERTSRLDALGQLTGGIAHDFNNLLATVQYALQLAKDDKEDDSRARYLDTALTSVERGSDLTRRLLAFAKQQPGLAASQSVQEIIEEFRKLSKPLIESNISLNFKVTEPDLWVFCDTAQLSNALLNLLLNARDAIIRAGIGNQISVLARSVNEIDADVTLRREHPGTYIAKGLRAEHFADQERDDNAAYRYIEFAVTDNGPGMSEEVKRRAIDPFFTTKNSNSGTGLGLSMVYGFVQQSNGELRIYSEPDQGTTVRLLLPRGTPFGTRENPVERLPEIRGQGERILVVEDEFSLLLMMESLIQSLGYKIETARSGLDALQLIEAGEEFDLMITDIIMPGGLDGFELAHKVRSIRPNLPIIYMSGYTGYSESDMSNVVAPMLQKPCPPAELAQAIYSAIAGG